MPFIVVDFEDLLHILEERPDWRDGLKEHLRVEPSEVVQGFLRIVDQITLMAEQMNSFVNQMTTMAEQMVALAEQMEAMVNQVDRLARWGGVLTDQISNVTQWGNNLVEQMRNMVEQVRLMAEWEKKEVERMEEERYRRRVLQRAPMLFGGGEGGAPDHPQVREHLSRWLEALAGRDLLKPEEDPTLSDLIWWKGKQVAVTGVAPRVKEKDVEQALHRAKTLRSVGVEAAPVVIGEEWEDPKAKELAEKEKVWWVMGEIASPDFLAFRRSIAK